MPGRPPERNPRRGNRGRPDWRQLPPEGYTGPVPAWPLEGKAPRRWQTLWRLPQAAAWADMHMHYLVARYTVMVQFAEAESGTGNVSASLQGEVRQLEDRLGLSPMAMRHLQWEVIPEIADDVEKPTLTSLDDRRARLA